MHEILHEILSKLLFLLKQKEQKELQIADHRTRARFFIAFGSSQGILSKYFYICRLGGVVAFPSRLGGGGCVSGSLRLKNVIGSKHQQRETSTAGAVKSGKRQRPQTLKMTNLDDHKNQR